MTSETFDNLSKQYLDDRREMDLAMEKLINEKPYLKKESLNSLNALSINFFIKFELFLTNVSSNNEVLSKIQINDILTSIENVLNFSIIYWKQIQSISENLQVNPIKPQEIFLRTSQIILKTYRKNKALEIEKKFIKHSILITGVTSKEKHKMTTSNIDWVSLIMGATLLSTTLVT